MPQRNVQHLKGFTLIEVLVSMVILAIGLLGLAAMQTLSIRDNQNAFFYAQASTLAYEMGDRIRANSPKVGASPWRNTASIPTAASSCDLNHACNTDTGCDSATMASFDYCAWRKNVQNVLGLDPATIADNVKIEASNIANTPSSPSSVCTGGASRLCLTIKWKNGTQMNDSADFIYQMEVTPQ